VDDEAVIAAYLRTRDPELFRVLVERHQARVLRIVASVLGPHADLASEEVSQEVFLRVHERLDSFRGTARFTTWLQRLAYNRAIEHRRRARIRLPHVSLAARPEPASGDPFDDAARDERRRVVARLLERLPDMYRSAIHMHYWLGCSVEETAEALDVAPGTVKSYLHRARRRLRDLAEADGVRWLE
jgi:RNA polymerase sigma-70 factor (ECF subfamily)